MPSFTDILNLTIDENDRDSKNDTHDDSDHDSDSHDDSDHDCERDSGRDNIQISVHCATSCSPIILQDEAGRSKEQKGNNKRSKRLDTSKIPRAKRPRLQPPPIITSKGFRKSESFDPLEFVRWLETNEHLRCINGGASKICELLDKVRVENPGLNEIFLTFADTGEQVDLNYFDIRQLVRPYDSLIVPPKWNNRTDVGPTYVWSFDIPDNDLEGYCKDLEKDISDHPHCNTDTADYRRAITAQFRNYFDKKVPLCRRAKVFHWLYLGQTIRSPPFRRWKEYYRKRSDYQRTLSFAMNVLVDRNVHHRLVVVSSDGSENMEAVVAALLNIHVGSSGNEFTAINRIVCGGIFKRNIPKKPNEQTLALQKYDPQIEMIIFSHCSLEITVCRTGSKVLLNHDCPVSGLRSKFRGYAQVYRKLFTQMKWCPSKDTCAACIVIVPRLENDIMKDLPLEEILGKDKKWKRNVNY